MEFQDALHYLWSRLPLLLLFANGYLVFRLLAVTKLTDVFVAAMVARSRGSLPRLLLAVMGSAGVLSLFIPNSITMLTMLPVLKRLDAAFKDGKGDAGENLTLPLTLAAIYGANIGGMGSLIGSPANLLLIGALDYFQVAGREHVTFASWLLWFGPLAAVFLLLAWRLLARLALPRRGSAGARAVAIDLPRYDLSPWQRSGVKLFILFLLFWTGEAIAAEVWPGFRPYEPACAMGFFAFFCLLAFFRAATPCQGPSAPLLCLRDLVTGLPLRGLGFLAVVAALMGLAWWLHLDKQAAGLLERVLSVLDMHDGAGFGLLLALVLTVILLTEVLSNTVVAAAFYPVAALGAQAAGVDPMAALMAVSLASTCAFATPIATPCNALAFGEMRGVRLPAMLGLGMILNVLGALLMAGWLAWILPILI